jgi:predicted glutamine amidotransferase
MCRLLGVVTQSPAPLTKTLSPDLEPFAALSSFHCDGWGAAWWDDEDLRVEKSPETASDSPRFWATAEAADTDVALLHLRKASEGMVPNPANTHPFRSPEHGGVAFAHNGWFTPVDRVEAALRERGGRVPDGDTDSERYFALVLSAMRDQPPAAALQSTARLVTELTDDLISLNAVMLTDRSLFAFSWYDEAHPPSQEAGPASYELMYRVTDDTVTVASDGWEPAGRRWERISHGTVLQVDRGDLAVTLHHS